VKKQVLSGLDFIIDKLTNSIENVFTGENFRTEVNLVTKDELRGVTRKAGWVFNWKNEAKQSSRRLYKLIIAGGFS
jgi:hypothetical protein